MHSRGMFSSGLVRRAVRDGFIQDEARLGLWELPPPLGKLWAGQGLSGITETPSASATYAVWTAGATLIAPG
jgi:hypothetical protein